MIESKQDKPQKSQATKIVDTALKFVTLFHDPDTIGYATVKNGSHLETHKIRSKPFKNLLSNKFYKAFKSTPGTQAIQDAISNLEGKALFESEQRNVKVRIGGDDNQVVIDLGNENWQCVVIDSNGWRIENESPVTFKRSRGIRSLPIPVKSNEDFRIFSRFLNIKDSDLPLALGWLLGAMRPTGPYPVLLIHGEQGSAKSTTSRNLRRLIDPSSANLRSGPREERDMVITASNSWVFALENLSSISGWLSDALCRMATGGGFAVREHYADDDEMIFNVQRPALINGIEEIATRSDLIDRSILLNLPTIKSTNRRTEKEIESEFNKSWGVLFGLLLDAASMAIRNLDATELESPPRLADFAEWVVSGEKAFGYHGEFMDAYSTNRDNINESAIEASPIGKPLKEFIEKVGTFEGNSSELREKLNESVDEKTRKSKDWPKSPRKISGLVRRIAPNLRLIGYDVELDLPNRSFRISMQTTVDTVATVADARIVDESNYGSDVATVADGTNYGREVATVADSHGKNRTNYGSDGSDGHLHNNSCEHGLNCERCNEPMIPAEPVDDWQNWDCPQCDHVKPMRIT